eukprot:CAMPEP_0115255790 /NCGR_PEP_ID=MMETSP0270-20121206/45905_1 /TAXON_ID=71861 /ORGANISM="Scrippsiella trochoidea, Strain CCMP3099" /LENGTH=89 /DNA_ID=CAMNT_0002671409 /DNA_START=473 /DNA_END=742 /DNA_ORIENTATION=-
MRAAWLRPSRRRPDSPPHGLYVRRKMDRFASPCWGKWRSLSCQAAPLPTELLRTTEGKVSLKSDPNKWRHEDRSSRPLGTGTWSGSRKT